MLNFSIFMIFSDEECRTKIHIQYNILILQFSILRRYFQTEWFANGFAE
jgi:hypothetical protein